MAELSTHFPWLAQLSPAAQSQLAAELKPLELPRGALVFDAGQPCQGFPLVESGRIRVSKLGPEGREILLYRIGPGESCILTSSCLLGASDYTARAVCETPVRLHLMPRARFQQLLSSVGPFREEVFHLFAERLVELMSLVDAVAFHRLDERLAARLLGHGAVVEASHQALALELGSVREMVSRILGDFEERGLVRLGRGRIEVIDAPGLRRLAGGSP